MERKRTRKIKVGNSYVGGNFRVSVQSMTNTDTRDTVKTIGQIKELQGAGCDIIRVAVPDMEAAEALKTIKREISIPLIADIHFDYRLAIESINNGVDGLRINPGNIGSAERIRAVVELAKDKEVPIRIGVNSGSLEKGVLQKYGGITPEALVESALRHVSILENIGFYDIVLSIKSSDVMTMIESYRLASEKISYPLHLGVTEAGTVRNGIVKSAVGIGTLLAEGIGDTIRVSLTGDPVEEVKIGRQILKSLGIIKDGIDIVSCPTCGRTDIDLVKIVNQVEERIGDLNKNIKVAIMGCAVNGPGEAREADIGVAGGHGEGLIFKRGQIIRKVPEDRLVEELVEEIKNL